MWNCSHCKEPIDDQFDGCWNCGFTKDGQEPSEPFQKENASKSLDDALADGFVCAKCGSKEATVARFAATGTGLSKFIDIQHKQFITISCTTCGYTEIYNSDILEGKRYLGSIIDVIFGS